MASDATALEELMKMFTSDFPVHIVGNVVPIRLRCFMLLTELSINSEVKCKN